MTISQLISELSKVLEEHGDLPVFTGDGGVLVRDIAVYYEDRAPEGEFVFIDYAE